MDAFPIERMIEARLNGWDRERFVESAAGRLRGGRDLLTLDGWWI